MSKTIQRFTDDTKTQLIFPFEQRKINEFITSPTNLINRYTGMCLALSYSFLLLPAVPADNPFKSIPAKTNVANLQAEFRDVWDSNGLAYLSNTFSRETSWFCRRDQYFEKPNFSSSKTFFKPEEKIILTLEDSKLGAHAMALWCSDPNVYLFDPNQGCIKIPLKSYQDSKWNFLDAFLTEYYPSFNQFWPLGFAETL
jgi:hypothetical protein